MKKKSFISKKIIKEYINSKIAKLKKYFMKSQEEKELELVESFSDFFYNYLRHANLLDEYEDLFDEETREMTISPSRLKKEYEDLFYGFLRYIQKNPSIEKELYPSWHYISNPEIVKNQWLIHFTNANPKDIAINGFKGTDNYHNLAYNEYQQIGEGFNFAYLLEDYEKYGKNIIGDNEEWKYGKNALLFKASGLRVFHSGDSEHQVIFWGPSAKNFVPIIKNKNNFYCVLNRKKNNCVVKSNKLEKLVKWIVQNYEQYRKAIDFDI